MVARRLVTLFWASALVTVAAQEPRHPATAGPSFQGAPCPFTADAKAMEQVRCGYVTVLENRAAPDGRRLKLAVAILESLSASPRPDPMVLIGGDPADGPWIAFAGFSRTERWTPCVPIVM